MQMRCSLVVVRGEEYERISDARLSSKDWRHPARCVAFGGYLELSLINRHFHPKTQLNMPLNNFVAGSIISL